VSSLLLRVGESHGGRVGLGLRGIEASLLVLDERARATCMRAERMLPHTHPKVRARGRSSASGAVGISRKAHPLWRGGRP
jgi:hypothetical protein